MMDRPLDSRFRLRRLGTRLMTVAAAAVFFLAAFWGAPRWLQPTLEAGRFRTATVETGSIEASISSSGTVVPEYEEVVSSPIDTRITSILRRPGARLSPGDPIVVLDTSQSLLALQKVEHEIELKRNAQDQLRLSLEAALIGYRSQLDSLRLELEVLRAKAAQDRRLRAEGLISEESLRQAILQEEKAAIEVKQLEEIQANARESTRAQLDGLGLQMETLEQELAEARRQLELATARSDREGVLTWVVPEEGTPVRTGDVIARIADLKSFRVQATLSDVHAGGLVPGMAAQVRIGEEVLRGEISSILPTIENGVITFHIRLEESSHRLLRANLRVDVSVITERKDRTLLVKRGPFASGSGQFQVFVLEEARAVRRPVRLGLVSFEHFEVLEGLAAGEQIIVSDTSDYQHREYIRIR